MWYLKKIPKIVHLYWGNPILPYLRYLTIYSFHKQNSDWEIRFYYPKYSYKINTWTSHEQKYEFTGKDYYPELKKLPIKFIEFDMNKIDISNNISEVFKSDYLRWYLLGTIGGLWADMDILFFKSMNNLINNEEKNKEIDTLVCICKMILKRRKIDIVWYHHSIGFMMASPNNIYYKKIWEQSRKAFNQKKYQSVGILLIHRFGTTIDKIKFNFGNKIQIQNIPPDVIYAYNSTMINEIYNSQIEKRFTKDSIGLHYYAGHPMAGKFINEINGENYKNYNNILGITIKKVLNG